MMPVAEITTLRALLLEDSPETCALWLETLEKNGLQAGYQRVETSPQLDVALLKPWDILLVGYPLAQFAGLQILKTLRAACPDIPILLISHLSGEELAVQAIKSGADDFILSRQIHQLPEVVTREIQVYRLRRQQKTDPRPALHQPDLDRIVSELASDLAYQCTLSASGKLTSLWVSQAIQEASGQSSHTINPPGKIQEFIHPDDLPIFERSAKQMLNGLEQDAFEFRFIYPDGKYHWLHQVSRRTQKFPDGSIEIVAAILDITPAKENELEKKNLLEQLQAANRGLEIQAAELQRRDKAWSALFNTISDALVVYDDQGIIVQANPSAVHGYGLDPVGLSYLELARRLDLVDQHGQPQSPEDLIFPRLKRGETISQQVSRVKNASGAVIWQLLSAEPVVQDGNMQAAVVAWKDITALESARLNLEENERTLRNLIEESKDGIVLTDEQGTIISWNPAQEQITGIPQAQAVNRPVWELQVQTSPVNDRRDVLAAKLQERISAALITGQASWLNRPIETPFVRSDGQIRYIESNVFTIPSNQGYLLGSIGRDVTERKRSEDRLRQARDHYLKLFENLPAMIWRNDTDGQSNYRNQTWLNFTGLTLDQSNNNGWSRCVHPDEREIIAAECMQSIQERQPFQVQYRLRRHDGDYRWVNDIGQPFYDLEGQYAGFIGVCFDIHDSYQSQREMETMLSISTALRSAGSPQEIMATLLDQLLHLVNASEGFIFTPGSEEGTLVLRMARGLHVPALGIALSIPKSQSGQIFQSGESGINLEMGKIANPALFPGLSDRYGIGKPLVAQARTIGVLWATRPRPFQPEEIRLISAITDIAATAIHRSSLNEEARVSARNLATIGEMGRLMAETLDLEGIYALLSNAVSELMPDTSGLIVSRYLPDQELIQCQYMITEGKPLKAEQLPSIHCDPLGRGNQSWVIHNRQPRTVNDLPDKVQSAVVVADDQRIPLSAAYVPMIAEGRVLGVLQVQSYTNHRFGQSETNLLALIANTAAIAIENADLFKNLEKANQDLTQAYDTTLQGWALALELRDQETRGHSEAVLDLTLKMAHRAGIPPDQISHVHRGAVLHDIGKMGIPDSILLKPGPLDPDEWVVMRNHPQYAYDLLGPIEFLRPALDIPYCHHERWDGGGYPRGLQGRQIPLSARIFAIVDVWNALQRDRPYRKAWTHEQTVAYIREQAGLQFDPQLVDVFLEMLAEEAP